jgi:hypothetical protein
MMEDEKKDEMSFAELFDHPETPGKVSSRGYGIGIL